MPTLDFFERLKKIGKCEAWAYSEMGTPTHFSVCWDGRNIIMINKTTGDKAYCFPDTWFYYYGVYFKHTWQIY